MFIHDNIFFDKDLSGQVSLTIVRKVNKYCSFEIFLTGI